jgi:DNA-binding CsgD family transcriptional regulator
VLACSVGGMLAEETSLHLEIQTKTVYNNLEKALFSVKASTTTEAVVKLYVCGLI